MSTSANIPRGFTLRHTLRGHSGQISGIAWSPNGRILASSSYDRTVRLWDARTGQLLRNFWGDGINVTWSPDGKMLASGTMNDGLIYLWRAETGEHLKTLTEHADTDEPDTIESVSWSPDGQVLASGSSQGDICFWIAKTGYTLQTSIGLPRSLQSIAWSPDGRILASGGNDGIIRFWNGQRELWGGQREQPLRTLTGHLDWVDVVAWSPNGQVLASGIDDKTIRLWDTQTGQQIRRLEAHTGAILSVSFSSDGRLFASKSSDGTVRLWYVDNWEAVAVLEEKSTHGRALAFHPTAPILATTGEINTVIHIWDLDIGTLLNATPTVSSFHYTNAKVVLVGDSGVGKSGLRLVLTDQPFAPTESTHGRFVRTFDTQEIVHNNEIIETRETLLWDLAGQPTYRIIHQLHLNDVAVTLVVFDAHSETDPFAGVDHWVRALRMAQRMQSSSAPLMKKFLVAARIDRGGKRVSRERIETLLQELGFDGYFETSAKEGVNIASLVEAIKKAIDWKTFPRVTSTQLFQSIKTFLVTEKEAGRLLSTVDDLYRTFLKSKDALEETEELWRQFETCIGLIESKSLIRKLCFGNLVLLQPEFLDAYTSALVNAVRDEPDGLGSITEERVRLGAFSIPKDERVKDKEQEKLLLIAMIEDLLRYEIALRDESYLIFPSQSTRENPDSLDPEGKVIIFSFEGPVENIYATLAVRLSHTGLFVRKELWKNALTYTTKMGGTYGMFLHNMGEGCAELTLFFDRATGEETRFHFEEYVKTHLQRHALPETLNRRRIYVCSECGTPLDDLHVTKRRQRRFNWIMCNICDTRVSLLDREERLAEAPSPRFLEMDRSADKQREYEVAKSTLEGKIATGDFDVFLCHNGIDKPEVIKIAEQLKERGLLSWLNERELRPGLPWQRLLESQIGQIKSAAMFVGKDGIGPWEQMELEAFLREFVRRSCPVIPVILTDALQEPKLPIFLEGITWVDFRKQEPDPLKQLIWGITGKRDPG